MDLSRLSKPTAASAGKVRTVANISSPPRPSGRGTTTAKRGTGVPSRGAAAARIEAHSGLKKNAAVTVAAADAATVDATVVGPEAEAVEDAEANGGGDKTADSTGQEHTGAVEDEVEGHQDGSAGHEEQPTCEERDHEDTLPLEGDATSEPDADPMWQSQSQTAEAAEDHPDAGEDVSLDHHPAPPGEVDAEHSIFETEAEAVSEPEPEAASGATEPGAARLDDVKARYHATVGNGLEDMVNMLQGGPTFPPSTHLVVAGEIPDED